MHTAPPYIYTLSLHDALPISNEQRDDQPVHNGLLTDDHPSHLGAQAIDRFVRRGNLICYRGLVHGDEFTEEKVGSELPDRKSTRLNSSHLGISYAVFCLKKKT